MGTSEDQSHTIALGESPDPEGLAIRRVFPSEPVPTIHPKEAMAGGGGQDSVSPLFYELGQEQGDLLPPRAGQTPKKHLTPL